MVTSSAFFGIKFVSCGIVCDPGSYTVTIKQGDEFHHTFVRDNNSVLKGFCLVGAVHALGELRRAVLTRARFKFI